MVDIEQEGFVKVLDRTTALKNYFFYLTFNNRAEIVSYENKEEVKSPLYKNNQNLILDKGNLALYYSYMKQIKNEYVQNKIKSKEIIMSFSTDFNQLMIDIYGLEKWKAIYTNVVSEILQNHFKDNKNFLTFVHTFDSQGTRIHNHTLLYPYKFNHSEGIYELYKYIPNEVLEELKKDFNSFSKKLVEKNKGKIKELKSKKKYKKYLNGM